MVLAQWWMRQKDALSPLRISSHPHLPSCTEFIEKLLQHLLKLRHKSLLLGVSGGNVGGMDADASLHGCIHDIFRKIYPIAVTISYVLNNYLLFFFPCCPRVPWFVIFSYACSSAGHNQAAPRTPEESPCSGGRILLLTLSEKTYSGSSSGRFS